jgi:cytochrome c oxidase cbb3-type subunit 3
MCHAAGDSWGDRMCIRTMKSLSFWIAAVTALSAACFAQAPAPAVPPLRTGDPGQSPASKPRPKAAVAQTYPTDQVREGGGRFASQCGFCHGRDATGGESGPDLTRSTMVAEDVRGDKLGPFLKAGRPAKGMPAYDLPADEVTALVAFIHTQMDKFATLGGGRRSVEPADLATGNAADGRAYFSGKGKCSGCHSATGDLEGIAKRYQGLALIRRMLYPAGNPAPKRPTATVTLPSGETLTGPLAAEDEFSVTVLDKTEARRKFERDAVKVTVDDPLSAHFAQLEKYTDADMHNVYAYLETLK